ncbi:MAG TPA: FG-GAP repeat protein [Rhodanobacteraceae bacterium]|nr:FG-GAP repeat protein [Rhodanobacteraceae bacterium]
MKRSAYRAIAIPSLACLAAVAAPQPAKAHDVNPLDPLDWLQEQQITADDGASNAEFGVAVALHGTTAMVGAQQATIGANEDQGAVYVFDQSGGEWTQSQKLVSDDGAAFDTFGDAVVFEGDTAIVGAYAATVNDFPYQGAAYVFTRSNGTWTQSQKLAPDDGTDFNYFGYSLALEGDTALIGADLLGAVYVFRRSDGTWTQSQKLTGSDEGPSDVFGYSVLVQGSTAFVGAYGNNGFQGAVYIFTESGGTWTETQKLTADDGASNTYFGYAIAVSGTNLLVGAWGSNPGGNDTQGAAYVFTESDGTWTQTQKLVSDDGAPFDKFGHSVAIDGTRAVIGADGVDAGQGGAQGALYIFDESGGAWTQSQKLLASDGTHNDQLGFPVALDGTRALAGAWGWPAGALIGAAYFFTTDAEPDDTIFLDGFDGASP